jgi:hypothetical protein
LGTEFFSPSYSSAERASNFLASGEIVADPETIQPVGGEKTRIQ